LGGSSLPFFSPDYPPFSSQASYGPQKRVYNKPVRKDSRYDSELVGHLINRVMQSGKKSLAERIVYSAIETFNEKADSVDPLELVHSCD
jgi:ribosomal protein S7